jgi:4-hydroxybenzoate polyprenyltransferase
LSLQTFIIFESELSIGALSLIFFATLAVYSLHRIVGLSKIPRAQLDNRFIIIKEQQKYLKVFLGIGSLASIGAFFFLSNPAKYFLLLLSLPSLAYIIPFHRGKRLRDFAYFKIFIVAIVWSLTTVGLPFVEMGLNPDLKFYLLILDRAIFIFAITVPFDIRDADIEENLGVKTLPSLLGIKKSIYLSIILLLLRIPLVLFIYPITVALAVLILVITSTLLVWISPKAKNDFFFTAILDGTMLLEGLTVSGFMILNLLP